MIDFKTVVRKFPPGTVVDLAGQIAMITDIWLIDDWLHVEVIFPRNVGRSLDLLTFNRAQAKEMGMDKWKVVKPVEFYNELKAVLKK